MADAALQVDALVSSPRAAGGAAELAVPGAVAAAPGPATLPRLVWGTEVEAWRSASRAALRMFALGILAAIVTLFVGSVVHGNNKVIAAGLGLSTVLLVLGVARAVVALRRIHRSATPTGWMPLWVTLFPLLAGGGLALFGGMLTLWAASGFARGRQLRKRGKLLLPPVAVGGAWAGAQVDPSGTARAVGLEPGAPCDALAMQWRENGRTEHASVAAFARLTLDLIALGAPPALVAAASRDALDEIRHAELCFSLARALDGRSESPGPFPAAQHAGGLAESRTLALAQLAVSSLVDGALHEGISARVIARLVKRCDQPAICLLLRELAADEGRHAAHGWDVVDWCLAEGGAPVAQVLRGALGKLPQQIDSGLPEAARGGAWERYGIPSVELEAEEHAKARADLTERVEEMIAPLILRAA